MISERRKLREEEKDPKDLHHPEEVISEEAATEEEHGNSLVAKDVATTDEETIEEVTTNAVAKESRTEKRDHSVRKDHSEKRDLTARRSHSVRRDHTAKRNRSEKRNHTERRNLLVKKDHSEKRDLSEKDLTDRKALPGPAAKANLSKVVPTNHSSALINLTVPIAPINHRAAEDRLTNLSRRISKKKDPNAVRSSEAKIQSHRDRVEETTRTPGKKSTCKIPGR